MNVDLPPPIFVDHGACPFQCCKYREWQTTNPVKLVEKPESKKVIVTIPADRKVRGLTGEVISEPLPVKVNAALPQAQIAVGETVYFLHWKGEGHGAFWRHGKIIDLDVTGSLRALHPYDWADNRKDWWVKVKFGDKTGWTKDAENFEGTDDCG